MPARVPISMAAPVPSDPTGRCPRGRPRKIPAAPPATERVPSGENLSGVPEHNPVPPGPPDDDVAITKIGEEAGTFLGVSRRAFAVVISDIADHLQCMLIERQQSVLLHRHGAAGDRVRVEHATTAGRAMWMALGIAKPPLFTGASDGSTLSPCASILTSDDAVISSNSRP